MSKRIPGKGRHRRTLRTLSPGDLEQVTGGVRRQPPPPPRVAGPVQYDFNIYGY